MVLVAVNYSMREKEKKLMKKVIKNKENSMLKKEQGITLVALVVTIILLFILVGVTLRNSIRTKWVNRKNKRISRKI